MVRSVSHAALGAAFAVLLLMACPVAAHAAQSSDIAIASNGEVGQSSLTGDENGDLVTEDEPNSPDFISEKTETAKRAEDADGKAVEEGDAPSKLLAENGPLSAPGKTVVPATFSLTNTPPAQSPVSAGNGEEPDEGGEPGDGVVSGTAELKENDVPAVLASAAAVDEAPVSNEASKVGNEPSTSNSVSSSLSTAAVNIPAVPLAAGMYMIATANSVVRVLDVAGGSKANGANVLLWDWHNVAWQKWRIAVDADGYYTFTNVHTGKALDVEGARNAKGANVLSWQAKSSNNANQRWILEKSGTGFIIRSAMNRSLVLDCTGNSAANGTNVEIWTAHGGANQVFNFVNLNPDVAYGKTIEDGIYTMGVSNKQSQVVEVAGQSAKNVANVDLYASNGNMNQQWSFQYNGAGLYKVINVGSGLALDVEGACATAASNVLQYASKNSKNQLWGVAKNADGTFSLYSALNGLALDVHGASTANSANVETYYPNGNKNQKFVLSKVGNDYSGTYRVYSRLSQDSKSVDVTSNSIANGTQLELWSDTEGLNQRFVFQKVGSAYSIRPVSSGKYLTLSGGKVVQMPAQGAGGAAANSQLWSVSFASDGFQLKNVGTGTVVSVAGASASDGAKLQGANWNGSASQKFLLRKCDMLPRGLYTMASAANTNLVADASGASFANGTNAIVYKSSGNNNQKFAISPVSGGYYRITLALGGTVLGVSGGDGASVKLYNWSGADSQLWKPAMTDGGFTLQNKASGMMLAAAGTASGNDVVQKRAANTTQQTWHLTKGSINNKDMSSFVKCLNLASGSGSLSASNTYTGFSTSSSQWKALQSALSACWNAGFDVSFIALDCETGMTVSSNADKSRFGASTIKALYVTYLCEDLLERGAISLDSVRDRMHDTIVHSDNADYRYLRDHYGSQSGFNAWLSQVGVGSLETWPSYSPRTLAKAWAHLLEYESSNGKYVSFWRSIFNHSDMSSIKDSIGGYRTVYSKPGWMDGGTQYGRILNDAGIVKNGSGSYVLAITSSAYPHGSGKTKLEGLVRAVDNLYASIPVNR